VTATAEALAPHAGVNVAFRVQAHPERTLAATALAREIGGDVVWDPDPTSPRRSPWRTFRHLMMTAPDDTTHVLQIQDDTVVCPGFRQAVERAVAARPNNLLVFYVGTQAQMYADAVMRACAIDWPWAELKPWHWTPVVSTCWPRWMVDGFLEWTEKQHQWPEAFVADDEIVGRYMKHTGHVALATVPSLVDHLDVTPSVMGRGVIRAERGHARRARCWIGDCGDCVEKIDWTQGPNPNP
jgi:hypothetical protein